MNYIVTSKKNTSRNKVERFQHIRVSITKYVVNEINSLIRNLFSKILKKPSNFSSSHLEMVTNPDYDKNIIEHEIFFQKKV